MVKRRGEEGEEGVWILYVFTGLQVFSCRPASVGFPHLFIHSVQHLRRRLRCFQCQHDSGVGQQSCCRLLNENEAMEMKLANPPHKLNISHMYL